MKPLKILILTLALLSTAHLGSSATRDIYPDPSQAKSDLAAALKTAAASHKRVLVDFGGNWCGDCHVLDIYFHNAQNHPILDANSCSFTSTSADTMKTLTSPSATASRSRRVSRLSPC